jgi:hypothetical protein
MTDLNQTEDDDMEKFEFEEHWENYRMGAVKRCQALEPAISELLKLKAEIIESNTHPQKNMAPHLNKLNSTIEFLEGLYSPASMVANS